MHRPHDTLETGDHDPRRITLAALTEDDHPAGDDALEDDLLREAGVLDDGDEW
jgi:hypothetical protein